MLIDVSLKALLGCLPVLTFLFALVHFDSFKLVRFQIIILTIVGGAIAAIAGYFINTELIAMFRTEYTQYMHFGSPLVEELLTAAVIVVLIQTNRVGFAFDSAILGFAAGAGFALVENFYFLAATPERDLAVWVIRGFGTAIMHGGTTAMFAMAGHVLSLRSERPSVIHYLPGFIVAVGLHSAFNFFLAFPVSATVVLVLLLPAIMAALLMRDKKSIHDWVEVDFRQHQALLEQIRTGEYESSRQGQFLIKMRDQFGAEAADKMVYYLELHTELVLAAEEILRAHENGEHKSVDTETKEKLLLMHEIEREIGKTGMLAMRPHLHFNRHEFWELYMLEKEAGFKHVHPEH